LALVSGCSDEPDDQEPGAPGDSSSPGATRAAEEPSSALSPGSTPSLKGKGDGRASKGATPRGLEMPSPSATQDGLPGLKSSVEARPVARRPWPEAAAAQGRLVEGFPEALGPVTPSRIISSSVAPGGDEMQVALEATTRRARSTVLRTYRVRMAELGFREVEADAVGGAEAVGFRRGRTSIVVTVSRTNKRTSYTVYGVVHDGRG